MKAYNNYVGTAYKYGLLTNPLYNNLPAIRDKIIESFKFQAEYGTELELIEGRETIELNEEIIAKMIIPFENVDGLTVGEIGDYKDLRCTNNYLVFVMYDSVTIYKPKDNNPYNAKESFKEPEEQGIARFMYIMDIRKYKDVKIDEVIEKHLIKNLDKVNIQNKRRALSFLEKYIYGEDRMVRKTIYEYTDANDIKIDLSDNRLLQKENEKKLQEKRKLFGRKN